jgi:hypothetical protein
MTGKDWLALTVDVDQGAVADLDVDALTLQDVRLPMDLLRALDRVVVRGKNGKAVVVKDRHGPGQDDVYAAVQYQGGVLVPVNAADLSDHGAARLRQVNAYLQRDPGARAGAAAAASDAQPPPGKAKGGKAGK